MFCFKSLLFFVISVYYRPVCSVVRIIDASVVLDYSTWDDGSQNYMLLVDVDVVSSSLQKGRKLFGGTDVV